MDSVLNVKEKATQGMIKVVQLLTDSNCFTLGACRQTHKCLKIQGNSCTG